MVTKITATDIFLSPLRPHLLPSQSSKYSSSTYNNLGFETSVTSSVTLATSAAVKSGRDTYLFSISSQNGRMSTIWTLLRTYKGSFVQNRRRNDSVNGFWKRKNWTENLFLFPFKSETSKQDILNLSPILFGNKVLRPWNSEKKIKRLKLNVIPVWVRFPFLYLQYFNPVTLGRLSTMIGKPMFMDRSTTTETRVAYARICIEIMVGNSLPKKLKIIDK